MQSRGSPSSLTTVPHDLARGLWPVLLAMASLGIFTVGFTVGTAHAHSSAAAERRRLADAQECGSGLDEILGITLEWTKEIRTEIQFLRSRPRWVRPLQKHYKSKSILQDVFVRFHSLCFQLGLLPITSWGVGRALVASPLLHATL